MIIYFARYFKTKYMNNGGNLYTLHEVLQNLYIYKSYSNSKMNKRNKKNLRKLL